MLRRSREGIRGGVARGHRMAVPACGRCVRGGRQAVTPPAGAGGNVVERHFNLAKQWRGLATRYDKLAITYRAAYILCACIAWTRA